MSSVANSLADAPVRKSISVRTGAERAFEVFTAGMDSWWPRSHHIGTAPMKRTVVECRVGGRCYSEQSDGTECDWAKITAWEPPRRFVMTWTINSRWQYEPDLSKASEVEVWFTPQADGTTRVDLEHRHFDRVGAGWETMRASVDSDGGWAGLLKLYSAAAESSESAN